MCHITGSEAHEPQIETVGNVPTEAKNDRYQGKVDQRKSFAHRECVVRFEIGVKCALRNE